MTYTVSSGTLNSSIPYHTILSSCHIAHLDEQVNSAEDDTNWDKYCMMLEVERIRQMGHPKKTWWDCVKNDMESLGLSVEDAQFGNIWRIKGATS